MPTTIKPVTCTWQAMSLGYRYLYGRTVPQKCEIAQLYYELAANHGIDELAQGDVTPRQSRGVGVDLEQQPLLVQERD